MGKIINTSAEAEFASLLEIMTDPERYKKQMEAFGEAKAEADAARAAAIEVEKRNAEASTVLTSREAAVARREATCDDREKAHSAREDAFAARTSKWATLLPSIKDALK